MTNECILCCVEHPGFFLETSGHGILNVNHRRTGVIDGNTRSSRHPLGLTRADRLLSGPHLAQLTARIVPDAVIPDSADLADGLPEAPERKQKRNGFCVSPAVENSIERAVPYDASYVVARFDKR